MSTDSIRVALLSEFLEMGGQERVIEAIARGLKSPFEPVVFGTAGGGRIADVLERDGIRVIVPGLKNIYSHSEANCLAEIFRQERIQLVHTHAYPAGVIGRRAVARSGISACVAHYHSVYTMWRLRHRWMERRLARRTHSVVCVSEAVAAFARDRVGIPPKKIRVVWNGVPDDFATGVPDRAEARRALELADEDYAVACVAGLSPHKGHRILFEALGRAGPGPLRLLLAGGGPEEEALRAEAERRLPGRVRFLGVLGDTRPVYAAADLFVLPSTEREGMSMVLLEAMASGLPVVATSVGGNPETVADGETGILCAPSDSAALADAIHRFRSDPALARRMGEAGRERCRRLFSAGAMIRSMEALYREALGAP